MYTNDLQLYPPSRTVPKDLVHARVTVLGRLVILSVHAWCTGCSVQFYG